MGEEYGAAPILAEGGADPRRRRCLQGLAHPTPQMVSITGAVEAGSGHGKDLSMHGLEDYTRIKHGMAYTGEQTCRPSRYVARTPIAGNCSAGVSRGSRANRTMAALNPEAIRPQRFSANA